MEENKIPDGISESSPEISVPKTKLSLWLENFWYHYKWHSIIALFLVFAIVVCSLQMCAKTEYDIYVVYAGEKEISHKAENGTIEYMTFTSSLKQVASDTDGDGEVSISLLDLFMLSSEQIEEAVKDDETEVNYVLIDNNNNTFKNIMSFSEYYLFFVSVPIYEKYCDEAGINHFENLESYASLGDHEYYDEGAIYLHSTLFGKLPGFKDLPENTLITLRVTGYLETDNAPHKAAAQDMLKKILTYGK